MATTESMPRMKFPTEHLSAHSKSIPILSSTSAAPAHKERPPVISEAEPMDLTPTSSSTMPPPATNSPPNERDGERRDSADGDNSNSSANGNTNGYPTALGAAAAVNQPKVVQTAFIHKLYNMLGDPSIQHLISWSNTNDSFVMSPSSDFSKVLSQYFKHTNISSFVRQLNMYGFHKVSDVFHNGAPDSTLWEFRHGGGNFKRGDVMGLREIKRRASRHTLINRDNFSTGPKSLAPAQTLSAPSETIHETTEQRLLQLEQHYFDVHARLARQQDSLIYITNKCQILSDGLMRCHQWNLDLATYLTNAVPESETQIHRDITSMQREIARQTDFLRSVDSPDPSPHEPRPSFAQPNAPFPPGHNLQEAGPPLSPRQMPAPDMSQRRPSQPTILEPRAAHSNFRTPLAPHLSISPRKYGSIGSNNSYSPSSGRGAPPPPPPATLIPPPAHPLANVASPPGSLSRRHTSADIRLHGWQGNQPPGHSPHEPPYGSGAASGNWPSSPARGPIADHQIRETLAAYELPRGPSVSGASSRNTPPPSVVDSLASVAGTGPDSAWAVPGRPLFSKNFANGYDGSGGPPTRRSSMASNLHGLLNPAGETLLEEPDSDGGGGKRKRIG